MKKIFFQFIFLVYCVFPVFAGNYFNYSVLPGLPSNSGCSFQPGLQGVYAGTDDNVLIAAGGANCLGNDSSQLKEIVFYDDIFILYQNPGGEYAWKRTEQKIPKPAAFGGAVETPKGLLCFGGASGGKYISESWLIDYIPEADIVLISPGPALPVPLSHFAYARNGNSVYVAGGISEPGGIAQKVFFSLKIEGSKPAEWKWEPLASWDGEPRAYATGAIQSNGVSNCFYLFSGLNILSGNQIQELDDVHAYDPSLKKWKIVLKRGSGMNTFLSAASFPMGASSIVFSSAPGNTHIPQMHESCQAESASREEDAARDSASYLVSFNTITCGVCKIAEMPGVVPLASPAVKWGGDFLIPTCNIGQGVKSPAALKIGIIKDSRHLETLDFIVIALYFVALAWMGYFFSKRQKNTDDYFKGGGRIPWWAAGLSIFGTALSAITFMAIPAKTYATDWSYFMLNMTIFLVAPVIVSLFIPFYRSLNITTAYEYLEKRFNLAVRLIGSLSFILFQVGRMGVVLFLPSIALNVVTGIDIFVCIALMGIVSLVYTLMGGIEAVIWTDVMQVVVLLGGAILSLTVIILAIDGGIVSIFDTAVQNHKFNIANLDWSLKQPTFWVILVGGMFTNITTYGTDQTMVQRYMTTRTRKEANQSVWTNAIMVVPATVIFFFIGTALFAFYKNFPDQFNPAFDSNDAIFPWYIVSNLPAGISGLLIAAIFAAAMSSLSSSMNSAATAYSTDIHFRFGWDKNRDQLKIAKRATLIIGAAGIIFAFLMATWDIQSLWDEFQKVLGLIIGSLGGVFLLGILSKRANGKGALIGIGISLIVQVLVGIYQPVHLMLYSATGVLSCFLTGWLASFFFCGKGR